MTALDILGMTAGYISAITFLPQVIKTWKSKSAEDVSLLMFTFAHLCYTMAGLWYFIKKYSNHFHQCDRARIFNHYALF